MLLLCMRGIIGHARYTLPSVYIEDALSMSTVRTRNRLTCLGISKSVRSPNKWLRAAPPSPPVLPVSELVSLPRPCLPRMDVFGGGVVAGVRV